MNRKIKDIHLSYENGSEKDGVVIVIEDEKGSSPIEISGTEWASRRSEKSFDVQGVQLTQEEVNKINGFFVV
jgi:hypothetical protein